jgi:hypothetical protein
MHDDDQCQCVVYLESSKVDRVHVHVNKCVRAQFCQAPSTFITVGPVLPSLI